MRGDVPPVWCPRTGPASLPRISIVTPNYNYAHFLEATLRSVLDQNYPNLEYLVLDDGSTDGSVSVIERYADRLAHWETGPNRGQYATITAGFARAAGDILGWLNSDDMHLPWTLWAVADIFATFPEVEWVSSLRPGYWDYAGLFTGIGHYPARHGFNRDAFLDGLYLPAPAPRDAWRAYPTPHGYIQQESTFWRRSLWERAGGAVSSEYGSAGDFDLWGRFFESAELVGVDIPLAGFRSQYTQQTAQVEKYNANCSRSLTDARRRAGWWPAPAGRRACYAAQVWRFPVLRSRCADRFGYRGRSVGRVRAAGPDPAWEIETYSFL